VRIEGWRIEGFGIFSDCEVRDLGSGLTVFLGPNEAGKSTLLAFLRATLFGFPSRRSRAPQYPPLRGGVHGGRIMLCGSRGEFVIERTASRRNGLRVNGSEATSADVQALLGGADENLFSSVFAFSLADMQSFEWLQADEVRERIFSAGIAGAGASARQAIDRLEEMAASIYRKRGGSRVKDILEQIDRAERRLTAAEADADRYAAREDEQEKWTAVAAGLSIKEQELRERLRSLEAPLEIYAELEQARADLAALPEAHDLSDGPEVRLAELSRRLETARTRSKLAATLDARLVPISDAIEELHSRLALHRDRISSLKTLPSGSRLSAWIAIGAAVAFAGGLMTGSGKVAAGVVTLAAGLLFAGLFLYQRAARNAAAGRLEAHIAEWEQAARASMGSSHPRERLILEVLELAERCRNDRQIRAQLAALDESSGGAIELSEAEESLASFRLQLRVSRRQRELRIRIAALEQKLPDGRPEEWSLKASSLRAAIAEVQAERDKAVGERRLAGAELARIAESADAPTMRAELECLRSELALAAREWRVATLAAQLVGRTLQEFTHTRQPAVLEEASDSFERVTSGSYRRIVQDESGEGLLVLDADGQPRRPEELSRGTAEQLYLCLRLALASEFARRAESLPLVMDDVLVNFDPERARGVARELAARSKNHQILIFTCHPDTARMFEEEAPGVAVVRMERYGESVVLQEEVAQQRDTGGHQYQG
jgi:uncharacterized protein YhaN